MRTALSGLRGRFSIVGQKFFRFEGKIPSTNGFTLYDTNRDGGRVLVVGNFWKARDVIPKSKRYGQ
ncbi:MAG: hypothetical protein DMF72_10170 [Acidobacteria bacterium]|nr:MAG: hypothetical protein DMF72_10170 [Acidobacteriota bacterium]